MMNPLPITDSSCVEDVTPTNSKVDLSSNKTFKPKNQVPSSSEPCLTTEPLQSTETDFCEGDEFFLVQYPATTSMDVGKSVSEPNVLESPVSRKLTYKLWEYYNDYENCLDAYHQDIYEKIDAEMSDSQIFNDLFLPIKSRSAPDVMDRSFVTMTYDPGPDSGRRKSAFVGGYANTDR